MKPVLILIAGGSASGKSTVVDKIQNKLNLLKQIWRAPHPGCTPLSLY